MKIIKFKGCRKCGGDLFLERDIDGEYICCLQCGAIINKMVNIPQEVPA